MEFSWEFLALVLHDESEFRVTQFHEIRFTLQQQADPSSPLQIKISRIRFAQVERSSYFSRCPNAIDGLPAECMEAIAKFKNTTALDASIIAGVQAVAL
jgi:hypothetical protein